MKAGRILGAVLGAAVLILCGLPAVPGAQARSLKAIYSTPTASEGALWIARDAGFFKKHGLDVDLIFVQGGSASAAAIISGQVQFGVLSPVSTVNSDLGGADLVMVANLASRMTNEIVARSGLLHPQDLKGKRIAIGRRGSSSDFVTRFALARFGLVADRDYQLIQAGGSSDRLAAIASGAADAGTITPAGHEKAQKMGFHTAYNIAAHKIPYSDAAVIMKRSFLKENRGVAKRIVEAVAEATHYYKTNTEGSLKIIAHYLRLKPELARYDYQLSSAGAPRNLRFAPQILETIREAVAEQRPDAKGTSMSRFVDDSFAAQLESSGFISRLYRP